MCAPLDKIKTKGGVKRKKDNKPNRFDVYRDPSYFEHVGTQVSQQASKQVSQQASKQISQQASKQVSQQASKQLSQQAPMTSQVRKYFDEFPPLIHPYIEDVVNVKADGNYGYRVIAALLGHGEEYWSIVRRKLYTEIKSKLDLYVALFKERLQEVTDSLLVTELEN
uniref:Uncharacterized protein LOC105852553 n=1 Tax=Cicer arietinum TaxID=3827 RepID=A0A1S3EF40_CICAR|nr:uncharacterized protein LOC105852553 [Cicer arietinum]